MKKELSHENGFGHIGLILAVVGVLAVGGLVAWRFLGAKTSSPQDTSSSSLAQKLAAAKCDYDDKDLCKFFVSWKEHASYRMVSSSTDKTSGDTQSITFELEGDKLRSVMTGSFASETITVGKRTYYQKTPDGTWWKQVVPEGDTPDTAVSDPTPDFADPDDEPTSETPKTEYKRIGKEACGNLTCFKYQVIDPSDAATTQYLWFDDKDYQLRRSTTDSAEQSSDTSFSYENISIKEPSTYKELGPDQYIMPGANEPTTLPSAVDYQ